MGTCAGDSPATGGSGDTSFGWPQVLMAFAGAGESPAATRARIVIKGGGCAVLRVVLSGTAEIEPSALETWLAINAIDRPILDNWRLDNGGSAAVGRTNRRLVAARCGGFGKEAGRETRGFGCGSGSGDDGGRRRGCGSGSG